ncbi:MAG: zinc ribbon domain-containing protein [Deltaproteobacteria bacterium]|nr:zinc ribbon domain-containing protein [Deltaproteobacteria bacterium]
MPIYEFKCLECNNIFEKLFFNSDEKIDLSCPECKSAHIERVVSESNYAMRAGSGAAKTKITTRSCGASNKCMTLDIPGPAR